VKNEVVVGDECRAPTASVHPHYRLKKRFSFESLEARRADCTAVQQVDNMPVTELLAAPVTFELEGGRRPGAQAVVTSALLVATYRLLVLMTEGYDRVYPTGRGTSTGVRRCHG
jgi:hypothetical protein